MGDWWTYIRGHFEDEKMGLVLEMRRETRVAMMWLMRAESQWGEYEPNDDAI